jgi:serine/threonine-protein kinase
VRVSEGQRASVVPVVADLPERTAEVTLTSAQIAIGYRAEVRSSEYRPGLVVAQDPGAGQRAGTVNLLVNRGDAAVSVVVPDLIGSLGVRAAEILRGQGFRVAFSGEVPYPGLPAGVVVRQTPQAGYRILPTETLTLEISR